MSNYILRLQEENAKLRFGLVSVLGGITQLQAYLQLPKFHEDTTVQVKDVLNRIEEIRDLVWDLPLHTNA